MDDYGKTETEVQTIMGGAYATLRGYGASTDEGNGVNCYPTSEYVFFLNECSSDEACIPTRGTDWYDGGRYQQLQYHTWDANNTAVLAGWRYAFVGVSKVNAIIYQVDQSELSQAAKDKVKAELRGLRAYYYYLCSMSLETYQYQPTLLRKNCLRILLARRCTTSLRKNLQRCCHSCQQVCSMVSLPRMWPILFGTPLPQCRGVYRHTTVAEVHRCL